MTEPSEDRTAFEKWWNDGFAKSPAINSNDCEELRERCWLTWQAARSPDTQGFKRGVEARDAVCAEIMEIMAEYDRQEKARGYVDTPGGLEHMGDVWRLLGKWRRALSTVSEDAGMVE